jgi:hypothetical protein
LAEVPVQDFSQVGTVREGTALPVRVCSSHGKWILQRGGWNLFAAAENKDVFV